MLFTAITLGAQHGLGCQEESGGINSSSLGHHTGWGGSGGQMDLAFRAGAGSRLPAGGGVPRLGADAATMAASDGLLAERRSQPTHARKSGEVDGAAWTAGTAVEAVAMKAALASAVRMEPRGLLPGKTGARVGLLHGVRTADMDKYDEVRWTVACFCCVPMRNSSCLICLFLSLSLSL